ncbi:MAG: aromatic ring-hydroxylating dioxygenase subunit alpha [Gammaproteobacteria bacterium]|nr:aromatic ring-hydroxylating dioxygenase subunit alpha [Gammaproteobacteria bacterium]
MEKATQIRLLKELLRQLDEKVNVDAGVQLKIPTSAYVSPELAEQEWHQFFQNHPQLIGLSGDLTEPGTFLTVDDFGVPILATRDPQGKFRAFINACRHRGVRIAYEVRGAASRFMCPFHNWTYANTGELVGIPREKDFGEVDRSCRGLIELPAEEKYGQLWVHPKPEGKLDVDSLLGDLAPEIEDWNAGELVYVGESVIAMNLNWKLANDTFGETYHFPRLHKDTLAQLFYGDALAYEIFGQNHRFVFASKGIDRLRELPEEEWDTENAANVLYYLFPNIQFNVSRSSVSLIKIYPDATNPGRSITKVGHYFSRDALDAARTEGATVIGADNVYDHSAREDAAEFSLEASMEIFDSTIEKEDYLMGETTQKSAENGTLDHLIFGRNEPALHHYHNTFRAALNLPPLEKVRWNA